MNDFRADMIIEEVDESQPIGSGVKLDELFQCPCFDVIDLKAVVPPEVAMFIESHDHRMCIIVPVKDSSIHDTAVHHSTITRKEAAPVGSYVPRIKCFAKQYVFVVVRDELVHKKSIIEPDLL